MSMSMLTGEAVELPAEKWQDDPRMVELYTVLRGTQRFETLAVMRNVCSMFARLAASMTRSNLIAEGDLEQAIFALIAPEGEGMREDDYVNHDFPTVDEMSAYYHRTLITFMREAMVEQLKCDRDALRAEHERMTAAKPGGPVLTVVESDSERAAG